MAQHLPSSSILVPPPMSLTVSSTTLTKQENEDKKSFYVRGGGAWCIIPTASPLFLCLQSHTAASVFCPSLGLCFCSLLRVNLWLSLLNRHNKPLLLFKDSLNFMPHLPRGILHLKREFQNLCKPISCQLLSLSARCASLHLAWPFYMQPQAGRGKTPA